QQLLDAGFRNVEVKDVTDETWGKNFLHTLNLYHEAYYQGAINIVELHDALWMFYNMKDFISTYLFARGQK
ncbi:MAG: hypothetical protein AAF492_21835, partial [Verrucomicrobiota bacterium]